MKLNIKSVGTLLFCILFFCLCSFFSLGMLIPGASSAVEGAEMPMLITDGRISDGFGDDFETWFSKRFAFRGRIVDLFSTLKAEVFGTGNDQVVVGEDGFLYFADTLDSFLRANPLTEEELGAIADALSGLDAYADEHGARLLFVPAPNKNTVYPEYMPARYRMAQPDVPSDLDRLFTYLGAKTEVEFLDLRPVLTDAKDEHLLYHKRDSHWNGYGAHVAYTAVMEHLGLPMPDFTVLPRTDISTHEGDLDRLLYPAAVRYDDDTVYTYDGQYIYTSAFSTAMDMTITTRSAGEAGTLLCFRDSFASAMLGDLAISFSAAQFERAVPYRIDLLETVRADVVIVEIAERNLRTLIGCDGRIMGDGTELSEN